MANLLRTAKRRYGIMIVAAVAVFGSLVIFRSYAATSVVTVEPENQTISGPAAATTDPSASGGKAIKFGGPSTTILDTLFPIGVFVPPASDFSKWKGRGVNTLVEVPDGSDLASWTTSAKNLGLYFIRRPASNPATDIPETLLLAWSHPDEPDGIFSQIPYSTIQADYNTWKGIDPKRNVYINFIGGLNQFDNQTGESGDNWYKKYILGADWVSADIYPVNNGSSLSDVSNMVDHLRALAGTKPVFAFVESGDYNTSDSNPVITPDQLRAEIWTAIIHGVRGIWYFPERITPSFAFDVTPAAVATEMTTQNNTITSLASVLQGPINPSGLSVSVASPLEAAWRSSGSGKYVLVLNMSNTTKSSQTINLTGFGSATSATVYQESRTVPITANKITDNFAPYAVHIYQIP